MKKLAIDIGQVICHLKFDDFNNLLAKHAGITPEEADNFLFDSQKMHDLGFSVLEKDLSSKFYDLNLRKDQVEEVIKEWHKTLIPNPIVMDWLQKLLDDDVEIVLVSNIGMEHAEHMKSLLASIYNHKNLIRFFSCEVGARKPTYVYYQILLNMFPQFRGCVYMDDNESNITSGKLFGFDSILFDLSKMNNEQIKDKLSEIEGKLI